MVQKELVVRAVFVGVTTAVFVAAAIFGYQQWQEAKTKNRAALDAELRGDASQAAAAASAAAAAAAAPVTAAPAAVPAAAQ